jgi:hypothetical protein
MAVDKQVKEKCWVQLRSKVILILPDDGKRAYGNTVYVEDENGVLAAYYYDEEQKKLIEEISSFADKVIAIFPSFVR